MYNSLEKGYKEVNLSFANMSLYRFLSFVIFRDRKTLIQSVDEEALTGPVEHSIDFMRDNIGGRYSVEDIATRFRLSASHYNAMFRKKMGMSPMDYFIRMKMQYACQLLSQSNMKIKEVSERLGYDDPYYFSRIFKKITGKSPVHYKQSG